MVEGMYVYCIIRYSGRKSFGKIGIGGSGDVYTIPTGDISAVVSNTPLVVYKPNEENALIHMNVIQRVMQEHTALPLKFSTVLSEKGLKMCLEKINIQAKEELSRLDGKVEVGVKVMWHPEAAMEEVRKTSDRVKHLEREMAETTAGRAYLLKVEFDRTVKTELNKMVEQYSSTIFKYFKSNNLDSKQSSLVGYMIMNGAFLIRKDGIKRFKEAVNSIKKEYEPKGLEIISSGPWPAFNFVNINYK